MKKYLIVFLLLTTAFSYSQEVTIEEHSSAKVNFNDVAHNKGRMFVYWGWNRGNYSKSDITFK
jgi:hypothetical protein